MTATTQVAVVLCRCGHAALRHDDDGCIASGCLCCEPVVAETPDPDAAKAFDPRLTEPPNWERRDMSPPAAVRPDAEVVVEPRTAEPIIRANATRQGRSRSGNGLPAAASNPEVASDRRRSILARAEASTDPTTRRLGQQAEQLLGVVAERLERERRDIVRP